MSCSGVTVTVLAENTAQGMGLLGEHGLSVWVETAGQRVLFDTGQGIVLNHNAACLNIDLARADSIVLSHGHYDHTGGLQIALRHAPNARMFMHPSALMSRFSCRDGVTREIGMPGCVRDIVNEHRASVTWTTRPTEVAAGVFVTGPIPRRTSFEDTGGPFFLDENGQSPDLIEDDQSMWIEMPDGLVILLGCAHSGVINTLSYIQELRKGMPIRAILGGMHLGAATAERMAQTVKSLRRLNVSEMWPCHCTGIVAAAQLTVAFGNQCRPCGVGTGNEF